VRVVPVRPEDLPELNHVIRRALPSSWIGLLGSCPGWQAFRLARRADGEVVAVGAADAVARGYVELRGIAVAPEHQGHGYGALIVRHLVDEWRDTRRATVCVTRTPAFFSRLGFVEADVAPWLPPHRRIRDASVRHAMVHEPTAARGGLPILPLPSRLERSA
jgi:predicted N-acetyltransferase YhbS